MLEQGLKKGAFLSSASCTPRKLKQTNTTQETKKLAATKKLPFKVKEEAVPDIKELPKSTDATAAAANESGKKREICVTPKRLLEPLASICKAKRLSRKAALKKVWCYIKAKKLIDPNDKSRIVCDERLRKMTKSKAVTSKALCGFLKDFMVPIKT